MCWQNILVNYIYDKLNKLTIFVAPGYTSPHVWTSEQVDRWCFIWSIFTSINWWNDGWCRSFLLIIGSIRHSKALHTWNGQLSGTAIFITQTFYLLILSRQSKKIVWSSLLTGCHYFCVHSSNMMIGWLGRAVLYLLKNGESRCMMKFQRRRGIILCYTATSGKMNTWYHRLKRIS